jgi:hypothetical protein
LHPGALLLLGLMWPRRDGKPHPPADPSETLVYAGMSDDAAALILNALEKRSRVRHWKLGDRLTVEVSSLFGDAPYPQFLRKRQPG